MALSFTLPTGAAADALHHEAAAAGNYRATSDALDALVAALRGGSDTRRILLRAAAGAGKSYALKRMVSEALGRVGCQRVGVTAFANKQIFPLAEDLGTTLGRQMVCLRASKKVRAEISDSLLRAATVAFDDASVPASARVILGTSHMFENVGRRLTRQLGAVGGGDHLFEALFVDEAWQLALHRYAQVESLAPLAIGVGDVGQLPPLETGLNPWRGDRGHNPYRAWPTAYEHDRHTFSVSLPAVWRPTAAQLGLWRAFYADWESLHCVAAPGDRRMEIIGTLNAATAGLWWQVATGVPTLVEVAGLVEPDAADVDLPLLATVEGLLDDLLAAGFRLCQKRYDHAGRPLADEQASGPAIAVLATRNQAVDDAHEMVDRLRERHTLPDGMIVASTVDSWQGQTNGITVAVHPLSGASALDEFNSAFGRLAVTCTRATHGLLLVSRAGLDDLLASAPPRPGTPLGEPGPRQLPRQTHQRILGQFARGVLDVGDA